MSKERKPTETVITNLRIREALRRTLEIEAEKNQNSLSREMVQRLETSLESGTRADLSEICDRLETICLRLEKLNKGHGGKGANGKSVRRAWNPKWRRRGKSKLGGEIGYSVERAGEILGLSRGKAYAMLKAGELPNIKIGNSFIVPKIPFHEKFGPLPDDLKEQAE